MKAFDTPSLLIHRDRVEANIDRMLALGGSRLMPHVKTHKMDAVTRIMVDKGIRRFKASTLAEGEMVARCGGGEVLIAQQLVGPKIKWARALAEKYPDTLWSFLVDDIQVAKELNASFSGYTTRIYIDVNNGMDRSGIQVGQGLSELIASIEGLSHAVLAGLHIYDGHITAPDLETRKVKIAEGFAPLAPYIKPEWELICGGSPAFSVHMNFPERTLSPGTSVFWDWGYGEKYPEQPYSCAAYVLTRVISKPAPGVVTVDMGHKAVSAENPISLRVKFPDYPDLTLVSQSEEHGVLHTQEWDKYQVGDVLEGIPYHVCPTVNLYDKAYVLYQGEYEGTWDIPARNRSISVC
jgi:3-hydroxy-D-aspartate aldolase